MSADHPFRRVRECHEVLLEEALTERIIGVFYRVYNALGYGFLESVYARALELELTRRGLHVAREAAVEVRYGDDVVGFYRADILVENCVVLELKATRTLAPSDRAQLLNCLRATDLEVGLLLHFGPRPAFQRLVSSNELSLRNRNPRKSPSSFASSASATDNAVAVTPFKP